MAALLFCHAMLKPCSALIFLLLCSAFPAVAVAGDAADGGPQSDPLTPALSLQGRGGEKGQGRRSAEAPPAACRDCELQYFPPSATKHPPVSAESSGPSNSQPAVQAPPIPGRSHLSSDPRVNLARALVERNRFAEALKILRPLVLDNPDDTDIQFLLGLAASRRSQTEGIEDEERLALLDEAIAVFRSILIRRPELIRVRLELALAFFLKEQDSLARNHFEQVLGSRPPVEVANNVRRFLTVIRARRRWTGYFGFSIAPDTNINAASDAAFIFINGLPFRRSTTTTASSDIGVVGWGGGEYQFPLADRWRLRSGLDLNHREYKGKQFDQTYAGVYAGPRWLINRTTEMSFLATASQRWFGQYSFNYDYGARLEVEHRLLAGLRLSGRALWSDRKYQQNQGLTGQLMVFSLGASYVLFPTVQVNALFGASLQDSQLNRWDSTGYWTRVGTNVALPWGFTVGLSGEFRWTDYEAGWWPFLADNTTPREDQTRILQATLLNRGLTVFGFSPQVAFSNQVRESNAQLFDFRRNLVEMRWVRQF